MEYVGLIVIGLIIACAFGALFVGVLGRNVSVRAHDAAQTLEVVSVHNIRRCYGCFRCDPRSVDDATICFGNGIYLRDKPSWWHLGWEVVDREIRRKVDHVKAP